MIYAVQTIWHVKEIVQFMSRICSGNSEGKYAHTVPGMVTTNSSVLKLEM